MWIWLDDVRSAPQGFVHIHNIREFEVWLAMNPNEPIEVMSFDHDLGVRPDKELEKDGYFIIKWLFDLYPHRYPKIVMVHSSNGPGAENIRAYDALVRRHMKESGNT